MTNKKGGSWALILFSLPFACVGLGFLVLSVIPSLYEWRTMKSWQPVSAQLQSAKLDVHHGDDSTTYQVIASYRYNYQGQSYYGDRVGIMSGSDNIGNWHEERAYELKRALNTQQPITIYVDASNPNESVIYRDLRWGILGFKMIFVVVFGGVGFGLLAASIYGRKKDKVREQLMADGLGGEEPWFQDPDWANPIKPNNRMGLIVLVFFAVIWNAISAPALFAVPGEVRSGNHAALIALVFPLVGVGLIIACYVQFMRWRRFGCVPLTLEPWPGVIGGRVAGSLTLPLHRVGKPTIQVSLCCLHSYYSGSGKNRSRREKVIWQKSGLATLTPVANATHVSFAFEVPEGVPSSQPSSDSYHKWQVTLKSKLKGADLDLSYEIPVFAAGGRTSADDDFVEFSDKHPDMEAAGEAELERLFNIQQLPDGIALNFGYFRNAGLNVSLVLFGLFFGGAGVFMFNSDAPIFMAIIFTLIGGGILLLGLYKLLNRYHVKLGARGIYSERYLLGLLIKKQFIPPESILGLVLERNGSSQTGTKHTEHFIIDAKLSGGKTIRVAESLNGRALAEQALDSLVMLSGFNQLKP